MVSRKDSMRERIERIVREVSFKDYFTNHFKERYRGNGRALCPFHDDRQPSFQVENDHGYCHAGCIPSSNSKRFSVIDLHRNKTGLSVAEAVESLESMFGIVKPEGKGRMKKFVKAYVYCDENGNALYEKVRYEPKSFSWRRFTDTGSIEYGLGNVRRVLYNLEAIASSSQDELIFFVEGEKDVDAMTGLGFLATTSGSAQGWSHIVRNHAAHMALKGHRVWVIADKDEPGRELADQVSRTLVKICPEVRILELPGETIKDASDLIEKHGDQAARAIMEQTGLNAPICEDGPEPDDNAPAGNVQVEQDEKSIRKTRFQILNEMVSTKDWEFFFDQSSEMWVSMQVNGHWENHMVGGGRFSDVLRAEYRDLTGDGLSRETIEQVMSARRGSLDPLVDVRSLETRVAKDENADAILVDTGKSDWLAVRITGDGYELCHPERNPFRRDSNMRAYDVSPDTVPGSWDDLFEIIPAKDFKSKGLIKMWMALSMIPDIAKPGLIINGPPGSGKSFSATAIRQIVDPADNPLQSFPKDLENLKLALFRNRIPVFDNMNSLNIDQSDCLCQAVTGISFEKRKLHTDADSIRWRVLRQWMLTGVNIPGYMADFLSRSFIIDLVAIDQDDRRDFGTLENILEEIKPGLQARLFSCASNALTNYKNVCSSGLQRLAHAHRYCLAMAAGLQLTTEEINLLWELNGQSQASQTVENDVVAQSIIAFAKTQGEWMGSTKQLYDSLTDFSDAFNQPWKKIWPTTPGNLTRKINNIIGSLKIQGVTITDVRTKSDRFKTLLYQPIDETSSAGAQQ